MFVTIRCLALRLDGSVGAALFCIRIVENERTGGTTAALWVVSTARVTAALVFGLPAAFRPEHVVLLFEMVFHIHMCPCKLSVALA